MGILITEAKLNEYSESITFKELFRNSKKKDDLADCYLQALTYSVFKKLINVTTSSPQVNYLSKVLFKKELILFFEKKENIDLLPVVLIEHLLSEYQIDVINKETLEPVFTALRMKKYLNFVKT